ncbi:hypothetical protein [Streptococcus fryi]
MIKNYVRNTYIIERKAELMENSNMKDLAEKVASLELALMDIADSVLDKEFPEMAVLTVGESLLNVDLVALDCLERLDQGNLFDNLWAYLDQKEN